MEETHTQGTYCHKGRTQQITEGDDKNKPCDYGDWKHQGTVSMKHARHKTIKIKRGLTKTETQTKPYQFDTETDDKHMDKVEGTKWDYRRGLTNLSSTKADRELMAKKNRKFVSTKRVKITP